MNRQISNTAPHWRATLTRLSLRSPIASSRGASDLSSHHLKIAGGICAAMMLACAFAANSVSAQTCPQGQENVRGTCRNVCADGEMRITSTVSGFEFNTGCFPDAEIAIVDDCRDAGWGDGTGDGVGIFFSLGLLGCQIPSELYASTSSRADSLCYIRGGAPLCADMYGAPPAFPKAAEHPDVTVGSNAFFVANCDRNGNVPGGYPPDRNLNGETECSCNPGSHFGEYPNCAPGPRLRLRLFLEGPLR